MSAAEAWADLHIHTVKSDGTFTVEKVFESARQTGVSAIAITDHDTVAGVEEALYCEKKYGVEFVPGVELSAIYNKREVHIIGLYVDWREPRFREKLARFQKVRAERAKRIIKKLKEHGLNVKYEELYEMTENMGNAGRLHIARLLVSKRLVRSIRDAFDRYLAEGRPAYVEKERVTVKEAIDMIRSVGGISVLAHPALLQKDEMIEKWAETGLDGIEAYHPDHKGDVAEKYLKIAGQLGLLVSGGSDCHGSRGSHGRIGEIKLPHSDFEKIREKYRKAGEKR
ncbi:MAG TPA: PHP domain-containing protein [bacterium]|nr:PHP domain-containing protein [bacterium]